MSVLDKIKVHDKHKRGENSRLKPAIYKWLKQQSTPYERNKNWGSGVGKKGRPDLEIIANHRTYYFELKDEKGELSPEQIKVLARYEKLGAPVYVVKDLAEFIKIWREVVEKSIND